jgi:Rab-GTPase-TBC domain
VIGDSNPHLHQLDTLLRTYAFFHFDLGYEQGLNDLLSPLLYVLQVRLNFPLGLCVSAYLLCVMCVVGRSVRVSAFVVWLSVRAYAWLLACVYAQTVRTPHDDLWINSLPPG